MSQAAAEIEKELEMTSNVYGIQRGIDGWGFILTADSEKQMERRTKHFIGRLNDIIKNWKDLEYFRGIGKPVFRVKNLYESFREADKVFAMRFTQERKIKFHLLVRN